jgi:hypothetical protein
LAFKKINFHPASCWFVPAGNGPGAMSASLSDASRLERVMWTLEAFKTSEKIETLCYYCVVVVVVVYELKDVDIH